MRKLFGLLVGAALTAALASYVTAQVTTFAATGSECWNTTAGAGGAQTGFLCINTVSGRTANIVGTIAGSNTLSGSIAVGGNFLVTAQPAVATTTWPANPVPDGAIVGVCNVSGSAWSTNAQTPAANSGQTMNTTAAFTTLAAGTCVRYQWNLANATWYRVQ